MNVVKFTLGTGKQVFFREPKMGDNETAAKLSGKKTDHENPIHASLVLQNELVKLLLVKVDETELTLSDKEQLGKFFSYSEFSQVQQAVKILLDQGGNVILTPEFVTFGDK